MTVTLICLAPIKKQRATIALTRFSRFAQLWPVCAIVNTQSHYRDTDKQPNCLIIIIQIPRKVLYFSKDSMDLSHTFRICIQLFMQHILRILLK